MKHFLRYHLHQNRTTYSSVSNSAAFYTRLNVTMCGFSKYHKLFFGEKKKVPQTLDSRYTYTPLEAAVLQACACNSTPVMQKHRKSPVFNWHEYH